MLNVLCVRVGHKYPADYVYKLKNMVEKHLKQEHRFICLTDNVSKLPGITCIAAPIQIADSWCKIGLFKPEQRLIENGDKCLYLDLDVIITGSLDKLIEGKLEKVKGYDGVTEITYEDADGNEVIEYQKNYDGTMQPCKDLWIAKDWRDPFNSSVMYWEHPQKSRIFGQFTKEHMERLRGDQNLIAELMPDAKTFHSNDILSYKFSGCNKKDEKPKCKIVLFHGKPKMHDLPDVQWIKEEWK